MQREQELLALGFSIRMDLDDIIEMDDEIWQDIEARYDMAVRIEEAEQVTILNAMLEVITASPATDPNRSAMSEVLVDDTKRCPKCGRDQPASAPVCTCGHSLANGEASNTTKPGIAQRVAVLVAPVALIAVTVLQWNKGEEFLGVKGGIVLSIVLGAIGFGLLGFANYLWTGKTGGQ